MMQAENSPCLDRLRSFIIVVRLSFHDDYAIILNDLCFLMEVVSWRIFANGFCLVCAQHC